QNVDALRFLDGLIGSSLHFETAGSLYGGRRVWALARLPEHVEVGGDPTGVHVLITNSHDGSSAVQAAVTPVRVVGQTTLDWGLRVKGAGRTRAEAQSMRAVADGGLKSRALELVATA